MIFWSSFLLILFILFYAPWHCPCTLWAVLLLHNAQTPLIQNVLEHEDGIGRTSEFFSPPFYLQKSSLAKILEVSKVIIC